MPIGKIFYSSWGYEQTNIDFYKVIEVSKSGKTITLQKVGSVIVEVDGYCVEEVVANPTKEIGQPLTNRRLTDNGRGGLIVNVSERSDYKIYAYEWDGRPLTQTSYY